jgi:hypothetical protein
MKKNTIAISILAVLAVLAWFLFRDTPNEEKQAAKKAIRPVEIGRVDGLRIVRHEGSGRSLREESIVVKKERGDWRIIAPVKYPAHRELIDLMLEELKKLRVIDEISEDKKRHRVLEVDDEFGIRVTAYSGEEDLIDFIVGVSNKNMTFVRLPGSDVVYRTVGSYRNRFDKSADSLRDKTITKLDRDSVTRVRYVSEKGELEMEKKGGGKEAIFEPKGEKIENFDNQKAMGNANALTVLAAKGFADEPLSDEITGFGKGATKIEFDAKNNGEPGKFTVWIGNDDKKMRQTYVKTSLSDQVYLASTHIVDRFRVGPSDFAMTNEQIAERKLQGKAAAEHEQMHQH